MPRSEQKQKAGQIESVIEYAHARLSAEQRDQADAVAARVLRRGRSGRARRAQRCRPVRRCACRTGSSRAAFRSARRSSASTTRVLDEHGWQSTHTVIEIVNDDMPFLVDSMIMEVNRQGLTLHLILHPVLRVRRDDTGNLIELDADHATAEGGRLESLIHVEVDRCTDRRNAAGSSTTASARARRRARRGARTGSRCSSACSTRSPRLEKQAAADDPRAGARGDRVPALAGRRQLHVARLPRLRPRAERADEDVLRSCRAPGSASCASANRDGLFGVRLRCRSRRASARARKAAGADQVECARHRAPARLPGLPRHQALRRRRAR